MTQRKYQVGDVIQFNERAWTAITEGHWPNMRGLPLVKRKKLAKDYYVIAALAGENPDGDQLVCIEYKLFNYDISSYYLEPAAPLVALAIVEKGQNDKA